jgi:hypothetical protein
MEDGQLAVPNISGIQSLGHTDAAGSVITVNGTDYTVASAHNADGTVANAGEYDVLKITIDGVDPKAIWNFSLTIAPQHYYGSSEYPVDIENNQFGVEYASFDFMKNVIQSTRNIKLPMGAGPYKVTNRDNADSPAENSFFTDNVAYFKRNDNFHTVGAELAVNVAAAEGKKCERCWKFHVHTNEDGLCPRCAAVVPAIAIEE